MLNHGIYLVYPVIFSKSLYTTNLNKFNYNYNDAFNVIIENRSNKHFVLSPNMEIGKIVCHNGFFNLSVPKTSQISVSKSVTNTNKITNNKEENDTSLIIQDALQQTIDKMNENAISNTNIINKLQQTLQKLNKDAISGNENTTNSNEYLHNATFMDALMQRTKPL